MWRDRDSETGRGGTGTQREGSRDSEMGQREQRPREKV